MTIAGARVTTIIGSLLIFLGILLSAFAPNIYFLYLTFGLIAGEFRCQIVGFVKVVVKREVLKTTYKVICSPSRDR